MDWDLAIKRHSEALKGIIAGLFAMLELAGDVTVARIPQSLHRAVRRVLRPAESAVRRLIVIAARGLVVKLARPPSSQCRGEQSRKGRGLTSLLPALRYAEELLQCSPAERTRRMCRASLSSARFHGDSLWQGPLPQPLRCAA